MTNRIIYLMLVVTIVVTTSCNYITDFGKPDLSLIGNSPYQLDIKDFAWSYGVVEINRFNGDFDKLDKKVYDLLKDKQGSCRVFLQGTGNDKYGNPDGNMKYIGDINIDELNKYQDWQYWQKDSGIRTLLYKQINKSSMDSVRTEIIKPTVPVPQTVDTTRSNNNTASIDEPSNAYFFHLQDMYPTQEKPSTLAKNRYIINGTIGEVRFNDNLFQVITNDGDQIVLQFYPSQMPPEIVQRLELALVTGSTIRCVGVKTDTNTFDLLAAKITPLVEAKKM